MKYVFKWLILAPLNYVVCFIYLIKLFLQILLLTLWHLKPYKLTLPLGAKKAIPRVLHCEFYIWQYYRWSSKADRYLWYIDDNGDPSFPFPFESAYNRHGYRGKGKKFLMRDNP